jgi:hemolysin activation/secretion protein
MARRCRFTFAAHTFPMPSLRLALLLIGWLAALCAPVRALAQDAAGPGFAIYEYEISGNTVLPVAAVEAAVLPFMGDGKRLADVEAAREALERAYQGAGYLSVFVDIPEQRVDSGVVQLRVIEGRVERLRVTGSRYYDQGFIRERLAQYAEGSVPNFNEAQAQVGRLNRDERQVQPVLRPGALPGTVEVEVKVTDRLPLAGSVELNNRHAAQTEPLRLSASLRYDNLFQRDHGLSLTFITAPQAVRQSKVLAANYTWPLDSGDTWLLSAVLSDSVLEPLGAGTVLGKGATLGARWVRGFAGADATHSLSLGADFKDQRETIGASGTTDALSTPLRYLPFQLGYSGTWFGERTRTTLNTSFTFGLRGLLARRLDCPGDIGPVDQFACKRSGADGGFATWRADLRHQRPMPVGPGTLALRLGWQLASQPLVGGEQYAIGGADSVRGYLEAEGAGDHALLGSLEWRSPNLAPRNAAAPAASPLDDLALLAFVDVARAQIQQPLPGQAARVHLLGSGVGLRVRAWRRLSAELDLAWALKGTALSPEDQLRLHLRLLAQF